MMTQKYAERLEEARLSVEGWMRVENEVWNAAVAAGIADPFEPAIAEDWDRNALYLACRLDGVSHKLAEMFALQSPPMSNTDREFLEGQGGCYDQFDGNEYIGNFHRYMAKKNGVDTTGKVYLSGLAAFPGDPKAWVSGRGDAQRVVEERGWSCDGSVKVKGEVLPPTSPKFTVADDIVAERAARLVEAGLAKPGEAAAEAAVQQLSPKRVDAA